MNKAEELARTLEANTADTMICQDYCDTMIGAAAELRRLDADNAQLRKELEEEQRINAMGSERELALMAKLEEARRELEKISQSEPPKPPPECKTEAEKTAFAFGWFKAMEANRNKAAEQPKAAQQEQLACAQIDEIGTFSGYVKWLPYNGAPLQVGDYLYTAPPQREPMKELPPGKCASDWGGRATGPCLYTDDDVIEILASYGISKEQE